MIGRALAATLSLALVGAGSAAAQGLGGADEVQRFAADGDRPAYEVISTPMHACDRVLSAAPLKRSARAIVFELRTAAGDPARGLYPACECPGRNRVIEALANDGSRVIARRALREEAYDRATRRFDRTFRTTVRLPMPNRETRYVFMISPSRVKCAVPLDRVSPGAAR